MGGVTASPPAVARPIVATGGSGLSSLGRWFLLTFLFLTYSRVTDVLVPGLRLSLITALLAALVAALTGGVKRAIVSRPGFWLTALSVWMVLAVPTSAWPGGSVQLITDQWIKSYLTFVILAGLLRSARDLRLAIYCLACANGVAVLLCLFLGNTELYGRLTLDQGVLSNPNDVAQLLLVGLPFLLFVAMSKTAPIPARALGGLFVPATLLVVSRTGSRGGIVAVVVMAVVGLISVSWREKFKLLGAAALFALVITPLLSSEQRARYLTTFETGTEENLSDNEVSAIDSREARILLVKKSVDFTLRHPIFGIGPGQFQPAEAAEAEANGERGNWHETHNTYTQISSETGIPGFLFFMGALAWVFRITRSTYKTRQSQADGDLSAMSRCLWFSTVSFAATAFFSSSAYLLYLPTLAGLAAALSVVARAPIQNAEPVAAAATGHPVVMPGTRIRPPMPV